MTAIPLMCSRCKKRDYCPMIEEIIELRGVCKQSILEELGEDCGSVACEDCLFKDNLEEQGVCSGYDAMTIDENRG